MKKRTLGYLLLSALVATTISCSSDKKQDEGVSPDVAEATSDTGAPPADGSAPADAAAAPDPNAPPAPADAAAAPDPNAPPAMDAAAAPPDPNAPPAAAAPETGEANLNAAAGAPPDPNAPPDLNAPPAADAAAPQGDMAAAAPPPADAGAPADSAAPPPAGGGDLFGAGSTDTGGGEAPAPKKAASVQHIKDAPFTKGGQNLNTVYIAREGDTLESISQKLFNEDRTKQLKKANPSLKKGVKPGDKVYFNSPNRPDDKEKMLTVYEDQGLPPSVYTTKEGDTLKSLAQEWYGSEASWKEVYAINRNLSSTKELPAGTELQYWPATAQVAAYGAKPGAGGGDVAQNNPPPPADQGAGAPPPPPPAPPADQANNNPPPPVAGTTNNPPPPPDANMPPPPPADMAPPPPPAVASSKKKMRDANPLGAMDKDTIMYAAAAGVCLIGGGLLIAIRRRNSRRNSGITQV